MKHQYYVGDCGSVEDSRCHLGFIDPKTEEEAIDELYYLKLSLENEFHRKNRQTILKMIYSKISKIEHKFSINQ